MNIVDVIIILLLIFAVARGIRSGLLQLLLSSLGFIGGLLLGSWISKELVPNFSSPATKLILVLLIEFGLAFLLSAVGEIAGIYLNRHAVRLHLGKADQALGAVLEVILMLAVVWIGASALSNTNNYAISHDVKDSFIVRRLDSAFPRPPAIFAQLEKIISPNGFPNVFLGLEPQHTTVSAVNSVNNQAVINDENSLVKIQGVGCGGIVSGSGFVVAKGIVVTNAHVVAGIGHPEAVDKSGTYRATPIWFDPNMDIAVLRVNGLADPSLTLSNKTLPNNDAAAILGFPGGGPLVADNAVIIDHVVAAGRNIYNQGITFRNVYEAQTDVEPGDSGGPLLAPDGSVAGVVFSKSLSQNNIGYALMIDQIKPIIARAEQSGMRISTGSCAAD